jgi:IS5 family transposase
LIEPHYPKAGNGRQPLGLEKMLRIYFLQQWFNLSDPQAEDAIYDSESMRRFARVELGDDVVPDETTILRFRHLLEQHGLTGAIFEAIGGLLEAQGLLLRSGTIVDATIIAAPSSTKNATATRDPEMKQTRQELALRDEAAHRHRPARHRAYGQSDRCSGGRYHSASRAVALAGA